MKPALTKGDFLDARMAIPILEARSPEPPPFLSASRHTVIMGMPTTLIEAVRHFANPNNCREYLVARRWPNGVSCPQCGNTSVYFDKSRNGWECKTRHPKRKFTLKTGTLFEDSALGLDKWLPCVWIIANAKNGVSSHEIARSLGVTQKTAWFMLQRIRLALQSEDSGKMGGHGATIEADETYIGGKARNMHASKKKRIDIRHAHSIVGKVAVMALLERQGKDGHSVVRTDVLNSLKASHIQSKVRWNVEPAANMFTHAFTPTAD